MNYIEAMHELRAVLPTASPLQLAIALEAVAFVHVESYMEHKPPPDCTPEQRAELQAYMIYDTVIKALNVATEVARKQFAKSQSPSLEDEDVAKAMADAAIAKARNKFN